MRIRKLELQGFKSFADRATFHFGAGISGVVGPNGCGKSNVVDGVKWCLGEQRVKTLRGDSMTDVIFAGSTGRQAVSFAEVVLTFTADDEPFPGIWARFPEIDVGRRLYRDGSSEYRINQEKVRLRDVNDLFMDSGAGNQLYSFIEQGRIGQIVQAHPEQRRTLIEEAAGISRYKARREETLQKLAATRTMLERVGDLTEEMGRQLKAAERGVMRVLRSRELGAKLRQEDIAVGLARSYGLIGDRRALGAAVRQATLTLEEAARAVDRTEGEVTERRTTLEAQELTLGELRDGLATAEADRRVEESAAQFQAKEASSGRERLAQLERDVGGLEADRVSADSEATAAAAALAEAERTLPVARAQAEAVGEQARVLAGELQLTRTTLSAARTRASSYLEAAIRARVGRDGLGARSRDLDERARRHAQRIVEAKAQDARATDEIARIEGQVLDARAVVATTVAEVELRRADVLRAEGGREAVNVEVRGAELAVRTAEEGVSRAQGEVRVAEEKVREADRVVQGAQAVVRTREQAWTVADRARSTANARLDAMDDALRRSADAPDGLQRALAVPGVIGLLATSLEVPQAREATLARALDGGLETVLVPTIEVAIAVAKAAAGAKARVLVVGESIEREGLPFVGGTDLGRRALAQLAPRVIEVESVEAAYATWRPGDRVLTADGAVLREDGVLALGIGVAGTAVFARRREVAALRGEVEGLEGKAAEAKAAVEGAQRGVADAMAGRESQAAAVRVLVTKVTEAQGGVEAARQEVKRRREGAPAADAEIRAANATLEAARQEQRKAERTEGEISARLAAAKSAAQQGKRAAEQLSGEGSAIERAREALVAEGETLAGSLAEAEAKQETAELEARRATRALEQQEPALGGLQADLSQWRMQISEIGTAVRTQGTLLDAARTRVERATARIGQVGVERSRIELRLVEIAVEAEGGGARMQALGEKIGALRDRLDAVRVQVSASKEAVRTGETAARAARDRRDAARDALGTAEARFAAVRDAFERLRADVEGRYEINLVALLDRLDRDGQLLLDGWESVPVQGLPAPESVPVLRITRTDFDHDLDARRQALADLRTAFTKIGEVSDTAEDEYRDIAERHLALVQQRADLEEGMRIIEDTIGQLNRTCRERFRETFDLVAERFAELYPRLVGGGSGRLALTNEDDLLVTGVEMFVQPPGKKVQSLSLLSGGEKAMAAIALIFSLFRVKPSPFCLLDEVDAPLDEGNGARFNDMLKEMSQRSQFIVITHNKKTMECADVLYGVSMPEPGTSRLVTVRLE